MTLLLKALVPAVGLVLVPPALAAAAAAPPAPPTGRFGLRLPERIEEEDEVERVEGASRDSRV